MSRCVPRNHATPSRARELLALHESAADRLAEAGEWRQACQHLRAALELAVAGSLRDPLTASYNRRYLDERLVDLPPATGGLAIAMVDIDLFKRVNDEFGHQVGDQVLRRVAALLEDCVPRGGFCARYGGEEFAMLFVELDSTVAAGVAERARARIAAHPWPGLWAGLSVTVSIGLAHEPAPADPHQQLLHADALLYDAKRAGRNRVVHQTARPICRVEHLE